MATKFITTFVCTDCGNKWKETSTFSRKKDGWNCPDCPQCGKKKENIGCSIDRSPAYIGSNAKSKAADIAYKMIESDYGMTNMKDNMREGDIAAILPAENPQQQSVVEQTLQQRGGFYGGGNPSASIANRGSAMQMAAAAKASRIAEGAIDPVVYAQNSMKKGPSVIDYARAHPIGGRK